MNRTGITTVSATTPQSILFCVEPKVAISAVLDVRGFSWPEGTDYIIQAGTPVTGNLLHREDAFNVAAKDDENVVGVLMNDADFSKVPFANVTVLIFGFVDMSKLGEGATEILDILNTDLTKIRDKVKGITFMDAPASNS